MVAAEVLVAASLSALAREMDRAVGAAAAVLRCLARAPTAACLQAYFVARP
jgi:hypothetical protein